MANRIIKTFKQKLNGKFTDDTWFFGADAKNVKLADGKDLEKEIAEARENFKVRWSLKRGKEIKITASGKDIISIVDKLVTCGNYFIKKQEKSLNLDFPYDNLSEEGCILQIYETSEDNVLKQRLEFITTGKIYSRCINVLNPPGEQDENKWTRENFPDWAKESSIETKNKLNLSQVENTRDQDKTVKQAANANNAAMAESLVNKNQDEEHASTITINKGGVRDGDFPIWKSNSELGSTNQMTIKEKLNYSYSDLKNPPIANKKTQGFVKAKANSSIKISTEDGTKGELDLKDNSGSQSITFDLEAKNPESAVFNDLASISSTGSVSHLNFEEAKTKMLLNEVDNTRDINKSVHAADRIYDSNSKEDEIQLTYRDAHFQNIKKLPSWGEDSDGKPVLGSSSPAQMKAALGLNNVDNTADRDKNVNGLQDSKSSLGRPLQYFSIPKNFSPTEKESRYIMGFNTKQNAMFPLAYDFLLNFLLNKSVLKKENDSDTGYILNVEKYFDGKVVIYGQVYAGYISGNDLVRQTEIILPFTLKNAYSYASRKGWSNHINYVSMVPYSGINGKQLLVGLHSANGHLSEQTGWDVQVLVIGELDLSKEINENDTITN